MNFREPSLSEARAMRQLVQPINERCMVLGEEKKVLAAVQSLLPPKACSIFVLAHPIGDH